MREEFSGNRRHRIRYAHGGAPPVGGRHGDLWGLVCGGIAAATAFAAAFAAAGGVASHPASPGATSASRRW
jgi:hypothetical protein